MTSIINLNRIILLSSLLLLSACNTKQTKQEDTHTEHTEGTMTDVMLTPQQYNALQMQADTLQVRTMSGYIEANGTLEVPPQNEAEITTAVGANVVSIEVIEGDKVAKGETVAFLSHPNIIQIQTDYLNAYSNSEFLEKDYLRQKKLYDAGVGSGANFEKAEANFKASKAKTNGLKAQLRQLNISATGIENGTIYQRIALRSPIEGFVQKVEVKTGQYVEPQTPLFEVVNTHHVHADLMVFEKDVHQLKIGQKVSFNIQSMPDKELTAEIYSIGKTFEQETKALHVHAEIENKEGNLIPGMYIQGRIEANATQLTAIPESAIIEDAGKHYIFSVEKEGEDWSLKPVEVITGTTDGNWTAISFLETPKPDSKFAYNNAYYLMAELKKGSAGHSH
ncbi:efflux RND transporter periplasmic adaptor subunit [Croceibacter atlanticus]|jgi:cobalt-zinc-cadmium efflux system membrane fusion protein|uniref:efflux RND transporter periplasmic adaptor subunit n=1 Tax=Croceibacter atlanticus TaxID=313588 RepID=UPI0024BB4864|nr:efflux RND transporter periplasmic adaptor subunit [Croceibacter atlanticus]